MVAESQHFYNQLWSDEFALDVLMVGGRMVLGPVIGIVELTGAPVDVELFLAFEIAQPMESHVHSFSAFGLAFTIDDSFSS